MANPNIELLTSIANAMGALREQVVFVGGCATGLLITQPIVADARATEDVDAIVEVASLVGYTHLLGNLWPWASSKPWPTTRHHSGGTGMACSWTWFH